MLMVMAVLAMILMVGLLFAGLGLFVLSLWGVAHAGAAAVVPSHDVVTNPASLLTCLTLPRSRPSTSPTTSPLNGRIVAQRTIPRSALSMMM